MFLPEEITGRSAVKGAALSSPNQMPGRTAGKASVGPKILAQDLRRQGGTVGADPALERGVPGDDRRDRDGRIGPERTPRRYRDAALGWMTGNTERAERLSLDAATYLPA